MRLMLPVAILAGGARHALAARSPRRFRKPWSRSPASRSLLISFACFGAKALRRSCCASVISASKIESSSATVRQFGLEVAYSFDGDGCSAPAARCGAPCRLLGEAFFVLYGDSYLDMAMRPIELAFRRSGLPALMTVFRNEGRWDTSNVAVRRTRVVRYDKRAPTPDMRYIDYGLGILTAKCWRAKVPSGIRSRATSTRAGCCWAARRLRGDPPLLRDRHADRPCRDRSDI